MDKRLSGCPTSVSDIWFFSFDDLVQRSGRIVHPGHHAAHIDPVADTMAIFGMVRLDLSPKLYHEVKFACVMYMPVEHPTVRVIIRLVERHGVMGQDNMPAVVRDLLVVLYVCKKPFRGLAQPDMLPCMLRSVEEESSGLHKLRTA